MNTYRILVVEDDPLVAESLQDILECLHHTVCGIAASGEEALTLLQKGAADLALIDIQLEGGMDGLTLAEYVSSEHQLPFIFTTAFADHETLRKAKAKGPYGYLVKPYGFKDLHAALETAMGLHAKWGTVQQLRPEISARSSGSFYIKVDSRLVKIEEDQLLYIEARGDYALFKTTEKAYLVHSTMKNAEQKLDSAKFLKVHRSFIVNLDRVIDIEENSLLIDTKVIPISRSHREALMSRIHTI